MADCVGNDRGGQEGGEGAGEEVFCGKGEMRGVDGLRILIAALVIAGMAQATQVVYIDISEG